MGRRTLLHAVKPVGFVATISSGVQSVIWACFYLAGLLTHYCLLNDDGTAPGFSSYVAAYLQGPRCKHQKLYCVNPIAPGQIAIWLVLGIISNLLLCTISIILFIVLLRSIKDKYSSFINTWLVISCATVLIDVALSTLFITDLSKFSNTSCMDNNILVSLPPIAFFFFSSRGILVTVANICFIVFFIIASCNLRRRVIKNSEMDLTSNWPSTSDSSYDFGSAHGDRDDLFGVVNPIQDATYPDYTAKGRWPSLQRNFNTVPHQHMRPKGEIDYPPPRLVRADYHMKNNDIYEHYEPIGNGSLGQQQPQLESSTNFNQDVILKILTNPNVGRNTTSAQPAQEKSQLNESKGNHSSNFERNRKISRPNNRYESKTVPSRVSSVPKPPPLPSLKQNNQENIYDNEQVVNLRLVPKGKDLELDDPDYTPVTQRKLYDINSPCPVNQPSEPFPFNNVPKGLPTVDEQRARFQMSLHEAIKSRPPLKPVLQRMAGVTEC